MMYCDKNQGLSPICVTFFTVVFFHTVLESAKDTLAIRRRRKTRREEEMHGDKAESCLYSFAA